MCIPISDCSKLMLAWMTNTLKPVKYINDLNHQMRMWLLPQGEISQFHIDLLFDFFLVLLLSKRINNSHKFSVKLTKRVFFNKEKMPKKPSWTRRNFLTFWYDLLVVLLISIMWVQFLCHIGRRYFSVFS